MDELITLKEGQLEANGTSLKEIRERCSVLEERNGELRRDFEVKVKQMERKHA